MIAHVLELPLIEPETAAGEAAGLLGVVQDAFILNLTKAMANSPATLRGYLAFSATLRGGNVSPAVRGRIALLVAQENECDNRLSTKDYIGTKVTKRTEAEVARASEGDADDPTAAVTLSFAAVAARREAPFFSDAERAGWRWPRAMIRLADRSGDAVSEQIWDEVADQHDEQQRAALILRVATTNLINPLTTTITEPAGQTRG